MKKIILYIVSILLIGITFSCNKEQYNYLEKSKSNSEITALENKLEKVYNMCLGFFSNKAQSKKEDSPLYRSQELIAVPIWPKRGNEYWLYICWLQENRPDALLSQEVWHFKKKDTETIEVIMYDLPNKDLYANDWRKKDPLANLTPNDLIDACTALLERETPNRFVLTGTPCYRNLSDAIKNIQVHGVLTPESMVLYNKMLDGKKEELFSYKKGLQFERQPKIFPKYLEEE